MIRSTVPPRPVRSRGPTARRAASCARSRGRRPGLRRAGRVRAWGCAGLACVVAVVLGAAWLVLLLRPAQVSSDPERPADPIVETPPSAVVSGPDGKGAPDPPAVDDGISLRPARPGEHPLDPALARAREALARLENGVKDYTATMVKRERIGGELGPETRMLLKVRREQKDGETVTAPFSVYIRFEHPEAKLAQEAIYVRGAHDGRLVGHEGPGGSFVTRQFRAWLDPEGPRAMAGEKYPIHQIGLDRMLDKLIERGTAAKADDDLAISQLETDVDGRPALLWKIEHTRPTTDQQFHTAQIWIDREHKLPVKYQGYVLPAAGAEPVLDEEYEYRDLKFNVGLTDEDFSPDNPKYGYPAFVAPSVIK